MIFSTLFGVLLFVSGPILGLVGIGPSAVDIVNDFFQGFAWGTPFLVLIATQQQFFFGIMKPHFAIVVAVLYTGLRVGLCWAMAFGRLGFPVMGASGLGHGSSLAAAITWLLSLAVLAFPEFKRFEMLAVQRMRKSFGLFKALCRIGIPIGGKVAVERVSVVVGTIMCGYIPYLYGPGSSDSDSGVCEPSSPLDINGVILQFVFLLTVPVLGLTQACGIAVARALGQGNRKWANQIGNICIYIGEIAAVLVLALYLITPRTFLSIFMDLECESEYSIRLTENILWISSAGQLFETLRNVASGGLRGYRDTLFPMIQGILWMAVINIPVTWFFALYLPYGLYGVYVVRAVTVTINAGIVYLRWLWLVRDKPEKYVPLDAGI